MDKSRLVYKRGGFKISWKMKVVVACDSFKGSATSDDVNSAVARAFCDVIPGCSIVTVPIADGGEGTVEALARAAKCGMKRVECRTFDPLMRPVVAEYVILDNDDTAIIELAAASGLPLVEPRLRNPLVTTTYGTGLLIKDAIERGCRRFVIGLGGSATNDGGMGLLTALGYKFVDACGNRLVPVGDNLVRVAQVDGSEVDSRVASCEFTAACDVTNPLVGKAGAAYVFAPQKGADEQAVKLLDCGLATFASVVKQYCGKDVSLMPGAGAAGGVGGGIAALLNASLKPGSEIVLEMARFDDIIADADLVITGEGKIDAQTAMGKAVNAVSAHSRMAGVPVVVLAGAVDVGGVDDSRFAAMFSIQPFPVSTEYAMQNAVTLRNTYFTARQIAKFWQASRHA